jgi:hypothetical protein
MLEDMGQGKTTPEKSDLIFFSEEKYFQEKPEAFDLQDINLLRETPTLQTIHDFLKALFECA